MDNTPEQHRESRAQEEKILDHFSTETGESLRETFGRLLKKMQAIGPRITIVDLIVNERGQYDEIVGAMKAFFHAGDIQQVSDSSYDNVQKIVEASDAPIIIIRDEVTRNEASHLGWIHSQDQGFKESADMRSFIQSQQKQIILARYWDKKDKQQVQHVLTLNDFTDAVIY